MKAGPALGGINQSGLAWLPSCALRGVGPQRAGVGNDEFYETINSISRPDCEIFPGSPESTDRLFSIIDNY